MNIINDYEFLTNFVTVHAFVPSFEGHKKHVIEIVVKLSVLNRNKNSNKGVIVITKVQLTHVYTPDI